MRQIHPLAILALALTGIAAAVGWGLADQHHIRTSAHQLDENLDLVESVLHHEVARFNVLPAVLKEDPRVVAALADPQAADFDALGAYLDNVRVHTGVRALAVTDDAGTVLAKSTDTASTETFDRDLALCAYFIEAMTEGEGCDHAIEAAADMQGYYVAARVDIDNRAAGTILIGVSLAAIEASWHQSGTDFALIDEDGIIFMSSNADWKYRRFAGPPATDAAAHGQPDASDPAERPPLVSDAALTPGSSQALIADGMMFWLRPVGTDGWHAMAARPFSHFDLTAIVITLAMVLVGLVVSSGIYIFLQRGQSIRIKTAQSAILQQRVEGRTRELQEEMAYRLRVERSLKVAENDLVQATKLAALGQLSVALAHEVSQPLTALAATLTAAERRLSSGDPEPAHKLVRQSQSLVCRLQHIIRHLRSFARKEAGDSQRMDMATSIEAAVELAATRAQEIGVDIVTKGLERPVEIIGSPVRLEQVLVNLLLNALDAVATSEVRAVGVQLSAGTGRARIEVWDTGPGMPEAVSEKIAEPFFTTKAGEKGLGLGLTISQSILGEYGGSMRFTPREGGGTVCEVLLPLAAPQRGEGSLNLPAEPVN